MYKTKWKITCTGPDGQVKWEETVDNLITTVGRNDLGEKYFKGTSYTAAWYVGLKGSGAPATSDTMSSHPNWTEITSYSQSTRPTLVLGTFSNGSASNTANKAVFDITGTVTVAGTFVVNNNTKGGTSGVLYAVADFSTPRGMASGDVLNAEVVVSVS